MRRVFRGVLIEVGRFDRTEGMIVEIGGKEICFQMTHDEAKAFAKHLYEPVVVTVEIAAWAEERDGGPQVAEWAERQKAERDSGETA